MSSPFANLTYDEVMESSPPSQAPSLFKRFLGRNNKCKIYVGGSVNLNYDYPYRLCSAGKVPEDIRSVTTDLIIDSRISESSITNKEVLEEAIKYSADAVIPKDYLNDIQKTHESIVEFERLHREMGCHAEIIIPLQPPHKQHYKLDEEFYSQFSRYAVGGVKNKSPQEKVQAVLNAREVVGEHKQLHGLGIGPTEEIIDAIWNITPFLDSLDTSSFETLPGRTGKIMDKNWDQQKFNTNSGKHISAIYAPLIEHMLYAANYQMTEFPTDVKSNNSTTVSGDTVQEHPKQTNLAQSWADEGPSPHTPNEPIRQI